MNMMKVCVKMPSEVRLEKIGVHQSIKGQFTIKYLQGGHVLADMKFLCFPCVFPVFFIEELTVIVIKKMSLAPSYTIYFLLKPYTA